MSENKQKTDFITVFATGIIGEKGKDYTQDALNFAKINRETLDKWVLTDQLFGQIYCELQSPQANIMTLQKYMEYVQGLRKKLLSRPDIIDVEFKEVK